MKKSNVCTFLLAIVFFLGLTINSNAQISEGGTPPSFNPGKSISGDYELQEFRKPDMAQIILEDGDPIKDGTLQRIAVSIPVNLSIANSGTWTDLPDGGRIWRLKLKSEDALALGVYYDDFWLPAGGKLFLYNEDKTQVIGGYTEYNNPVSGLFANELIQGETVTLEYLEPAKKTGNAIISISEIAYAYRNVNFLFMNLKDFGDAASCEVNINCSPEGNNWQDEKRGVARILIKTGAYYGWCSGSLVNNTDEDCTPYFLTAFHCGDGASTSDLNQWTFYFNYEASGCSNPGSQPSSNTMTGCSKKAEGDISGGSDFYLVELNNIIPDYYSPYYNGWNRVNTGSTSGVSIHHPSADIKKISTYSSTLSSSSPNIGGSQMASGAAWRVNGWVATTNGQGVSEEGSSGSPIFDNNGRVVGTLSGGSSDCSTPSYPDYYGKFWYHWDQNGGSSTVQLKPWLDPGNTGANTLSGTNQPCGNNPPVTDFIASATLMLVNDNIDFTDLSSGATSWSWTFTGGNPASSTLQNPVNIQYTSPGLYTVSLTATNTNGSDTETKVDYIEVVNAFTVCDTLHYPLPGTPTLYGVAAPESGYLFGNNSYGDEVKADYFDSYVGFDQIESVLIWFAAATISGGGENIEIAVWDDSGGSPNTQIGSKTIPLSDIVNDVNSSSLTHVVFDTPIAISGPFYVGVILPAIAGDTVAIVTNADGDTNPGTSWERWSGGTWYSVINAWGINIQSGIWPVVCPNAPNTPPVANFSGSPLIIFVDDFVDFTDQSINSPTSWNWSFTGGNPFSSTVENPANIQYTLAGTFDVSLTAANAYGSDNETKTNYIEVVEHTCENVAPDYTMGFEAGEDLFEWKIENSNGDNTTWAIYSGLPNSGTYSALNMWNNDAVTAADDWIFTKCLELNAANSYELTFYYRCGASGGTIYPEKLEVKIGNDQLSTAMTQTIIDLGQFSDTIYQQSVNTFSVGTTGQYYIGFHAYSDADQYFVALDDINIETSSSAAPVADFTAYNTTVCAGDVISFTDISTNVPTSWSWTFTGGTPNSSTAQNPTITYNTPGTYTVTLTAANTYGSDVETKTNYITVTAAPSINQITTIDASCGNADGQATATVSGGTAPYTYSWSSGCSGSTCTGLSAGSYSLTVTDAGGCTNTSTFSVNDANAPTATISINTAITCNGNCNGSLTVTATGGTGAYTYSWNTSPVQNTATATGLCAGSYNVTVTDAIGCSVVPNYTLSEPTALSLSTGSVDATCGNADGQASVTVSGGTTPYTYNWSNGCTNPTCTGLLAASYSVTVTDGNGCTASGNTTVNASGSITATISASTDATCNGICDGTATASGSNGTAPYTYSWNTTPPQSASTATGLCAGISYTVSATDANGCSATASVSVSEPTAVSLTTGSVNSTCGNADGEASVTVTSGITPYTYSWSNGCTSSTCTGLSSGSYSVSVTDGNGCTATDNVPVNDEGAPTLSTTKTDITCYGDNDGTATVTAFGGTTPLTYLWDDPSAQNTTTATGLAPGT
ncbi:MAG: PKD domain-containing protein, partial [Bacteroidota bacterium]